mmetsp:Transcript_38053/g.94363  ORF Transcript_38053/g.94363 Transcript_38053/m.94363 type:complete len:296 (-) Transcript_38053:3121-4008(-)
MLPLRLFEEECGLEPGSIEPRLFATRLGNLSEAIPDEAAAREFTPRRGPRREATAVSKAQDEESRYWQSSITTSVGECFANSASTCSSICVWISAFKSSANASVAAVGENVWLSSPFNSDACSCMRAGRSIFKMTLSSISLWATTAMSVSALMAVEAATPLLRSRVRSMTLRKIPVHGYSKFDVSVEDPLPVSTTESFSSEFARMRMRDAISSTSRVFPSPASDVTTRMRFRFASRSVLRASPGEGTPEELAPLRPFATKSFTVSSESSILFSGTRLVPSKSRWKPAWPSRSLNA